MKKSENFLKIIKPLKIKMMKTTFKKNDVIKTNDGIHKCIIADKSNAVFGEVTQHDGKTTTVSFENLFIVSNQVSDVNFEYEKVNLDEITYFVSDNFLKDKPLEDSDQYKEGSSQDIRRRPSHYNLNIVLKEIMFGRPAFDQKLLKETIDNWIANVPRPGLNGGDMRKVDGRAQANSSGEDNS